MTSITIYLFLETKYCLPNLQCPSSKDRKLPLQCIVKRVPAPASTKQTSKEPKESTILGVFYLFFYCCSAQYPTVLAVREDIVWNMHLSCMVTANLFYLNQFKPNETHIITVRLCNKLLFGLELIFHNFKSTKIVII